MRYHALIAALGASWPSIVGVTATPIYDAKPPSIQLSNGTLVGSYNPSYHQDFFLGVPFAASPTGDGRLRMPAPPKAWNGTKAADSYGPWCFDNSIALVGFSQNTTHRMSEDCLHLNLVRPAGTRATDRLPVLAWIHGGGWQEGSANDGRYNGSFIVQRSEEMGMPIIFVSFNYRLGVFGMMAGSAIRQANATNLGLHDQRQALAWVQENIGAFGGDPSRVTVMGESAGALSIGHHLHAHGGRDDGLFSAAITQSGGPFSADPVSRNYTEQEADFELVLNMTGCADSKTPLDCLRGAPAEVLNEASILLPPYFVADGQLLSNSSMSSSRDRPFVQVPLLTGTTRNEGTSFTQQRLTSPINTDRDFQAFIRSVWGGGPIRDDLVQEWTRLYQEEVDNPSAGGLGTVELNPGPRLGALYGKATLWIGDMIFTAGRRFSNHAWAEKGVPSYSYLFDTVPANVDAKTLGAAHYQEIPYVFGNTRGNGWVTDPFPKEPDQRRRHHKLAEIMSSMWISFAVTHSPNFHQGT